MVDRKIRRKLKPQQKKLTRNSSAVDNFFLTNSRAADTNFDKKLTPAMHKHSDKNSSCRPQKFYYSDG
jgi:hypothetical protein